MLPARSSPRTVFRPAKDRPSLLTVFRLLMACTLALAAVVTIGQHNAQASTSAIRGVNWADQRDNFVNGVLYPSGLSSSDTYSSAATVADRVVGQLYTMTGANTLRLPVNEPTVSSYWGTYTGAIDTALTKGNVILAYWAYTGGKPPNTTAFYQMWDRIVGKYAGNPHAYFEVINEPYGLSTSSLDNLYNTWLTRYPGVPRGRVILDGSGLAQNAAAVGNNSRLNNTLIGIHDYTTFVSPPYTSEAQWAKHLAGEIGGYASRTVVTEWGAPMSPGTKNGVYYNTIDYNIPGTNYFDAYVRGESSELRTLGVGSVYWPGLRDGDWYSMTAKSGTGSSIKLALTNASGLSRLQYAWGIGDGDGSGGTTYVELRNAATSLCIDGTGSATNGVTAEQSTCASGAANQEWTVVNDGSDYRASATAPPACTWTGWAAPATDPRWASGATPTAPTSSGRSRRTAATCAFRTAPLACSSTAWAAPAPAPTWASPVQLIRQHQPAMAVRARGLS